MGSHKAPHFLSIFPVDLDNLENFSASGFRRARPIVNGCEKCGTKASGSRTGTEGSPMWPYAKLR